ncbi:MAG: hypothetical protein ACOX02_00335 [Acholeplasmatales bacterium]
MNKKQIDERKLNIIIKRIIEKEKHNFYEQRYNEREMVEEIKKVIQGELR